MLSRHEADKPVRQILGLMSGTSCDGIDLAWCEVAGSGGSLLAAVKRFHSVPYSADIREKLLRASEDISVSELALLNFELGKLFATTIRDFMADCAKLPSFFHAIGSHGHTIRHLPALGATLQIGEGAVIAQNTGLTTVSDFRVADLAAGGQGAPLMPYVDWCLLRDSARPRIVQNIGGIANCTVLPPSCRLADVRAWDTGPGNMVMDECMRQLSHGQYQYDEDGALAAKGEVDEGFLTELMQHPYFARPLPKTCGREEFGHVYAMRFLQHARQRGLSAPAVLATATALTARSIAYSYRAYAASLILTPGCEIILGGGGARNPVLRRMLQNEVAPALVHTHEHHDMDSDAKEALGFAVLAHETLNGVPANVPSATGASRGVVLGKVSFGNGEG